MHIYFSGIGGTGIGPLALIAHQAGYKVSGSDKQSSQYTDYLTSHGVQLHIGQTGDQIAKLHQQQPIDWFVYSSALPLEQPDHPEIIFAREHGIRLSKRDEFLNHFLKEKNLKMLAVAGTHGKTTTTAMLIWACRQLGIPTSYSVGAKISFGDMGKYSSESSYFIYECDEFDKNFLQFYPYISLITSIDWDHQEIYKTRDLYKDAFRQFISQSSTTIIHQKDADYLQQNVDENIKVLQNTDRLEQNIQLLGMHNRQNARLVIEAVKQLSDKPDADIISAVNSFPGVSRRFEKIANGIYSDYAHTPEEIAATLQLAHEQANDIVVVYEPLTDRRQHYVKNSYGSVFETAKKVYWLPSYLAREDSHQDILLPQDLITSLSPKTKVEVSQQGSDLKLAIDNWVNNGALVLCMAGGGGGSLDEWLRKTYK